MTNQTENITSLECRFQLQLRMLEKGAEELQGNIGRIDDILFKIKASGITVWVALIGWAFTTKNFLIIPLGWIVIIGFWLLEGFFRGIQERYLLSSFSLTRLLNDRQQLDVCFEAQEFPPNMVYPMAVRESPLQELIMYARGLIAPAVSILYLFLGFINYLIWIAGTNN